MIDEQIRDCLGRIHDPCSIAAGRPLSLLDMGLVRGWTLTGGTLHVVFCVTFPGCTMAPHFVEAAALDLAKIDGVGAVETSIDTSFAWTPDLMQQAAPPLHGSPQAWRERVRA